MKELRCAWCQQVISLSQVKVKSSKAPGGAVVERRCPHCGKTLAAYLEEDGSFFPKLRTF